jgi:hemoglobin-like flavoprotein
MLTDTDITLVQSSFAQVLPIAEQAGMLLYGRIFELAPEARALFGEDVRPQARRLMAAVQSAVDSLRSPDELSLFLLRLGARHGRYGVVPAHFDVAGGALMWTLEQGLGAAFTPEVQQAWAKVWDFIADTMLTGLRHGAATLVGASA